MTIRALPMASGASGPARPESAITNRKMKVPTNSVSSFAASFIVDANVGRDGREAVAYRLLNVPRCVTGAGPSRHGDRSLHAPLAVAVHCAPHRVGPLFEVDLEVGRRCLRHQVGVRDLAAIRGGDVQVVRKVTPVLKLEDVSAGLEAQRARIDLELAL